jgi:hypothetical protein
MFYVQIEHLVKVMLQSLYDAGMDSSQTFSHTISTANQMVSFKLDLMMLLHQPLAFTVLRCISLNRNFVVSVSLRQKN